MAVLYVVVPCYNEREVLPETNRRLTAKLREMIATGEVDAASRILYVDDGSTDETFSLITRFHEESPLVCGIRLAHNRGHQTALLAGLLTARERCDCAASMDADLQDDINVLDGFMEKYKQGCHVVYGVRSARKTDTAFKRSTAHGFYRLMEKFGVELVYDHADCRLLSRQALDELARYPETNLFLRGMVPHMGFQSDVVYYERADRFAGKSKYPLKKMLGLAADGITSFSVKPLRLILALGVLISALSAAGLVAEGITALCGGCVAGLLWAVTSLWLLGGLLLTGLGVVGEYIGKLYGEAKGRPRFAVEKALPDPAEEK